MSEPTIVAVPMRVCVDPPVLAERVDAVGDAVSASTATVIQRARQVPALQGGEHALTQLKVDWSGIQLAQVSEADRRRVDQRIRASIRAAAAAGGLKDQTRRDPFAPVSGEELEGAERAAGPVEIDVARMLERLRGTDVTDRGIAMLELHASVVAGDPDAVYLALMAIQPDDSSPTAVAIEALKALWTRDPDRFYAVLAQLGLVPGTSLVERTDTDFKVDEQVRTPYGPLLGAIERLAREIPEANIGPKAGGHGVEQLLALLEVWRQAWIELGGTLRKSKETTDAGRLASIGERPQNIQSLMGILAAYSGDQRIQRLIPGLRTDVQEAIVWTVKTIAGIAELEALLAVYRDAFGSSAPTQEEVQVLQETRTAAIRALVDAPLPRGSRVRTAQDELAEGLASWRMRAADRRVQRLRTGYAQLTKYLSQIKEVSPYYERMMGADAPWEDVRVPYFARLGRMRLELADIGAELDLAAEHPTELEPLLAVETKLAMASIRLPVLSRWMATLQLQNSMRQVGTWSEHEKWMGVIEPMRKALGAAYDKPDLTTIERDLEWWAWDLESIEHELVIAGRRELVIDIGINIAAMLLTAKIAGGGGGGAALTRVTLAEAVTFTALTSIGRAVLLDRPTDPSAFVNETIDNFIMFGAFKVLNIALEAGALRLLRGRPIAQLTTILGVNTVIASGLPLLVMRFQAAQQAEPGRPARPWGEPEASAIATGLILNAVMAAVGGRQMLTRLQALGAEQLRVELAALYRENLAWGREFRGLMDQGTPAIGEFNAVRRKGVALCRRTQKALKQLADLPPDFYPDIGTPNTLRKEADNVGRWADAFESMDYHPPAGPGLLPPGQVAPGAIVPIGRGLSGYRPDLLGNPPPALVAALERAGYKVKNDSGVLLLTAGEGQPVQRLLPAGTVPQPARLSRESAEAQALILSAAGPGRKAVSELLDMPRGEEAFSVGEALTTAAQLEPELIRQAILADGAEAKIRLDRLLGALAELGLPAEVVDLVKQGTQAAASARRTAEAVAPREDLVAAAGGSLRAREALATVDGRALLDGARRAPAQTRAVLMGAEDQVAALKAEAVKAWQAEGMPADRVEAATHALDALLEIKNRPPMGPVEELGAIMGGEPRYGGILESLKSKNPDGYAALLKAVEQERELVGRVARATEERTRTDSLSQLAHRLQREGMPTEQIKAVGDTLLLINERRQAVTLWAEEIKLRSERVAELADDDAFRRDADVVIKRFRSPRRERAQEWLKTRIGGGGGEITDTYYLTDEVYKSPALQEIAARGGATMLRQLWTMFRAGRARAARVQFAEYVEILQRIHRGLHGEYSFTFWVGDKFVVLKAPDAGVTVPGTDIILVPRGGGAPIWVDQKSLSAEVLYKISALTRNLPRNVEDDLELMEALMASGHEYPQELLSALPLQREANLRIQKIVAPLKGNKDLIESPAIQQRIAAELKKLGIRRVAGVEGGQVKELGEDLKKADFSIFTKDE